MRISIGSDHRGYELKQKLVRVLMDRDLEVFDEGTHGSESVDYPDIAAAVSDKVSSGAADRGILICGTGIGMAIAANKRKGVRAAPCHDEFMAEMSRRHNDLNVLCLSSDMLSERRAVPIVDIWLNTQFEGGRHQRRVDKLNELDERNEVC